MGELLGGWDSGRQIPKKSEHMLFSFTAADQPEEKTLADATKLEDVKESWEDDARATASSSSVINMDIMMGELLGVEQNSYRDVEHLTVEKPLAVEMSEDDMSVFWDTYDMAAAGNEDNDSDSDSSSSVIKMDLLTEELLEEWDNGRVVRKKSEPIPFSLPEEEQQGEPIRPWPVPQGVNWNKPLVSYEYQPGYYEPHWVECMIRACLPKLEDLKGDIMSWVADHQALQWLVVLKAIEDWGHENLMNKKYCFPALGTLLSTDPRTIEEKYDYWLYSTSLYVAYQVVEEELDTMDKRSDDDILAEAAKVRAHGPRVLKQVKRIRGIVEKAVTSAARQLLEKETISQFLLYQPQVPTGKAGEAGHQEEGTKFLPPIPMRVIVPWEHYGEGGIRYVNVPTYVWVERCGLVPWVDSDIMDFCYGEPRYLDKSKSSYWVRSQALKYTPTLHLDDKEEIFKVVKDKEAFQWWVVMKA